MLTVACVLRTGGEFLPDHVVALRDSVARHLRMPHRFLCLTDDARPSAPYERFLLRHAWPGWWSKIELFSEAFRLECRGRVLYMDLDTVAVRPMNDLVLGGHKFVVLRNFWKIGKIGSGLMAWSAGAAKRLVRIYDLFSTAPSKFMAEYKRPENLGDQAFISAVSPIQTAYWQDIFPGRVVSFRKHCIPLRRIPVEASVVCFGGRVRPWNISRHQRQWFEDVGPLQEAV